MTVNRVTQVTTQNISQRDPHPYVTQVTIEVLSQIPPTFNRVSQVVTEVLTDADPNARVSQLTTEVLTDADPSARVSQNVVETLSTFVPEITEEGTTFLDAQDKSASSTWDSATTSLTINTGQYGIIILVTDNEDNSDGVSELHISVSVGGNELIKGREYTASQGAPNAGSTVSIWYFKSSELISSGAIVAVTLNTGRTAKALTGHVFDIDSAYEITGVDGFTDEAITASTPGTLSATGVKDVWHFWVRSIGMEYPTDTLGTLTRTNKRWFGITENGSTGNPNNSNQSVRAEYKIAFGVSSGDSTPSLSASADGASTLVGLSMGLIGTINMATAHVAHVGVFNVDSVGTILKKDDPNVTLGQQLQTSIDHLMIEDSSLPNTTGSPTVKAYLELEAAGDFILEYMDLSTVITYLRNDTGGYP